MTVAAKSRGFSVFPELVNPEDSRDGATHLLFWTIGLVIACQFGLIFVKAVNWDEFLHFGHIYELADGRLTSRIQTLPTRLFGWATWVSDDVVSQIQAIRIVMLACAVLTAVCIVALAKRLVKYEIALLCGLVYLTAGFVFTNAFTYRPDPVSAAALMSALYFFASGKLTWKRVILIGLLIGLAGAVTIKSIFYLPCFAAIAWLRWEDRDESRFGELVRFFAIAVVSIAVFASLIGLHGAGLSANDGQSANLGRSMGNFLRFFEFEKIRYVGAEAVLAPLVTIGLISLPFIARRQPKRVKILLIGLCGPLLCLLFYRNTFPYFFTFLLPPICVAIAPVLSSLVERYGRVPVVILALFGPIFLLTQEPYGTLERQRATIQEVERLFPEPTPYLSYSNYMPHYPRQFPSLISGVGLRRYWDQRSGQIATDIEAGNIAFVIATGDALDLVYKGGETQILPEQDVAALQNNFLQYSDTIYIAGRKICPQKGAQPVEIYRDGPYAVEGGALVIDGRTVADGDTVRLKRGRHSFAHEKGACIKLWALDQVPQLPEGFPSGPIAGGF